MGLGMFPWACAKRKIPTHGVDDIKCDRHHDCGVQDQVEHHEEIKCLKLVVHCGDNGIVEMCQIVVRP